MEPHSSNTLSLSIRGTQQVERDPWFFGRMYRRAVQQFSDTLNKAVPTDVEVPEGLGDTALDVVLRAWLAVCDNDEVAKNDIPTREELYDRVLSIEFARWRKEPKLEGISRDHLRRAAATLSLLAPKRDTDEIDDVLSYLPEWNQDHLLRNRLAELVVQSLLRDDGANSVSLRPDPVAERLILDVFGKNPELLDRVLPQDPAQLPGLDDSDAEDSVVTRALEMGQQVRNACVTLTRASSLDREVALRLARRALRERPFLWKEALDVALIQGGPLAPALEALIESGATLPLGVIDDAIPVGHPALAGAALAATMRLATSAERSPEQQAHWANNLSIRLSDVGERKAALEAAREAVELYRGLAEATPAAYTPNLAVSLNNLANRFSEMGERNDALEAAREAVELYRGLAEAAPQAYTPKLAASLNNLANCLSEVGERNEALVAAREAVELYRGLAEATPAAYTPDLAGSLTNLANRLSAVGKRNDALVAAREAVELYRGLAEATPQAYTPNLAMSFTNLANRLSAVGERNEALVAAREAVELYRGLAEATPQAYAPDLAGSLNNLAIRLSEVGKQDEALEAAREAVRLRRALAEATPAAYTPDLAGSLNNLAIRLSEVGERNEALEAAREAVELYRGLAEATPAAYTPDLAMSLNNLANILSEVGKQDEALEAAREAVRLRRALAEATPQAYVPDLAGSLNNLANILSEVGKQDEALEAAREAVRLRRALAESSPAAYAPDLAGSLNNLANRLSAVGKRNDALVAAREAVELYRGLAEATPAAYTPKLAVSLTNLANRLSAVGERNEALVAAREAVELYRGLAEATPAAYTPNLAMSLNNLANRLSAVGERNEALVAAREAVELYRGLAEATPAAYTPNLAMSLNNLANRLSAVGERNEALEAAREAVELYRGLAEATPAAYTPNLAASLNNLANILSEVGKQDEALEAAREAVRLRRALAEATPQAYTPNLAMSLTNLAAFLSEVGERNEALEAAREAVELYRGLAEATPAAYTLNLAGSLNNLAAFLSEVGERTEALEAAREAVELYRGLAEASPQAYTPNLAMSLNNLANLLSEVGERNEALETFVEGFDCFLPAVRARLLVARATWRDDGGEAGDVVAAAREADSTDDPVLLGPVRRMIARVITDAGIMGTGLPRWVTVDAESATSRIKGWLECSDLAQRVAFLEAQWSSPSASERETLAALAELYVDRPSVAELAALVERIADSGIQAVTTDLRTHHRAQLLARDWYEAHLNGRGASFLREHMRGNPDASRGEGQISEGGKQEPEEWEKDLGDPDMRIRVLQVLAATLPEDEVAIMDAIIELAQLADQSTAYDAQRSDEGAEDTLREFLEARNWRAMILVLGLRPSVAESTYGRIARLLSAVVTDEPVQRLRELYEHANEEMDAIHRRQLQALLDKALGTDQCPPAFADILSWTRNSGSRQQ